MTKRLLKNCTKARKFTAFLLVMAMVFTCIPESPAAVVNAALSGAAAGIVTVDDPSTLTRPLEIYGNDTHNAGKITVGKSVSDEAVVLTSSGTDFTFTPKEDNFLITYSQTAQVMGLAAEIPVPVDAVFVLDTSASMNESDRAQNMVTAANKAIKTLLDANENSRVAVVAFSSADSGDDEYGGGTSNGAAASVLSSLKHYDTTSDHLTWVNSSGSASGNNRNYIAGRDSVTVTIGSGRNQQTRTVNAYRHGFNGGTHIQAGIALGAQQLMDANNNPIVTIDGDQITRLPFLIILSDGAPTFSADEEGWYDLDVDSADEQGPGSSPYEGNGFLAALTAAYYKGAITDKYFGAAAGEDDRCFVYTIGLNIGALDDGDEEELAKLTLDPKTYTTGNYASGNSFRVNNQNRYSYYYYGNSHNDGNNNRSTTHSFRTYWNNYTQNRPANFTIRVNSNDTYTIDADTISATKNYVNGYRTVNGQPVSMGYAGGIIYNDDHFSANSDGAAELEATFEQLVRTIQLKAISTPTQVTSLADFDGYVHYYDPIGEYMEVKDIHGVVNDGYNFQGASFARLIQGFNSSNGDAVFDATFREAVKARQGLTDSQINSWIASALQSSNQAYYSASDFDNSLVWWGKSYPVSAYSIDDDAHAKIQWLAPADDDSVEYIESAKAANQIPADADYICRSYYFHGTAGGELESPVSDAMLFVVRIQRSLKAPYKETVVISIPASLLCVEKVLITEKGSGSAATYEATVEKDSAVRFVYEVGLRSDINAQNVSSVVDSAYASETVAHDSADPALQIGKDNVEIDSNGNATYYFYTNDWDRSQTESAHLRAMARVSYDSAPDNEFYRYQEDTPIYADTNGTPVSGSNPPASGLYYYKRTYYDWDGATLNANGSYTAAKKEAYIQIRISDTTGGLARHSDGNWYIQAGTYTASTMLVTGDDITKGSNNTETSAIVTHPVRTNDYLDSHYTVYLGNNGRLALAADKTKTVGINLVAGAVTTDQNGQVVTIGDVLTYQIKVVNNEGAAATAVVTDKMPAGTKLVPGSITDGGTADSNGNITWNLNLAADEIKTVSFAVEVTEDALHDSVSDIENTASIKVGNSPAYDTNKVDNPTVGKIVEGATAGVNPEIGIQVGQELVYHIYYVNATDEMADITITDIIPAGTNYVPGSATHGGQLAAGSTNKLVWTIEDVLPERDGTVTFRAVVDASAQSPIENGVTIQVGTNGPTYTTNSTSTDILKGDLQLSKTVTGTSANETFTLVLTDLAKQYGDYGTLSGSFDAFRNGTTTAENVTFTDGVATVTIKHNDTLIIKGLPAGTVLDVTEQARAGYTPTFTPANGEVVIAPNATTAVAVANAYATTDVNFQLIGKKVLTTDDYFNGASFVANVYRCTVNNGVWTVTDTLVTTAQATVSSSTKEAAFVFAPRTFTQADIGEHYYLITEFNNHITGVTYDETQYRLKIEVKDEGNGTLSAIPTVWKKAAGASDFDATPIATGAAVNNSASPSVVFTNEYQPMSTSVILEGNKTMTNRYLEDNQFAFEVYEGTTKITDGYNVDDGDSNYKKDKIVFRPITYTQEGTHTYTVKEVNAGASDITYDPYEFTVTVVVTDSNHDGHLEAAVTYPAGGVEFTNTYKPAATSISLTGTKTLTGRTLEAGEFTFEVMDGSSKIVATGHNEANGSIAFSSIPFSYDPLRAYPYEETYTVKEAIPTGGAKDPYMGYDQDVITVTVVVAYDEATGILSAGLKNGSPAISFENTQYPNFVTVEPDASKATTVSSGDASQIPSDATFSFSVINTATGQEATVGIGQANGSVDFGTLTFSHAGTYKYWIQESNAANTSNGITYDPNRYLMEIVVTHVNGKLEASTPVYYSLKSGGNPVDINDYDVQMSSAPVFNNVYDAKGSITITAKKQLNGRELNENEFAFKLIKVDASNNPIGGEIDGLVKPDTSSATVGDGIITFATMYYSLADITSGNTAIVRYAMSEVIPSAAKVLGVTYDNTTHYIEVKLTNNSGVINAEIYSIDGNAVNSSGITDTGITFTNTYAPTQGTSVTMNVSKSVVDENDVVLSNYPLVDGNNVGKFTFDLYYKEGATETLVASVTNNASGEASFTRHYLPDAVVFPGGTHEVTYTYVIRERAGALGGMTYSNQAYWVKVTVRDDTQGNLVVNASDIKYYSDEACTNEITNLAEVKFTNKYVATTGTAFTPTASKKLTGRDMFRDNEFAFEVKDQTTGDVVSAGLSKLNGDIVFTPVSVNTIGEHVYIISEVEGNLGGVDYSDELYYVKVKVSDSYNGYLVTDSVKYYSDAACTAEITDLTNVKFTNTYTTETLVVQLEATKTLTGRDMEDHEFDFVVKDMGTIDKKVVAYGDNVETGTGTPDKVVFSGLSFTLSDAGSSFLYEISEVVPVYMNGVSIDASKYLAEITIVDEGSGKLRADIRYFDLNHNPITTAVPAFANVYDPVDAEVAVIAHKTLIDKQLKEGEFSFKLSGSGTDYTVQNNAAGEVIFPVLTFDEEGTYNYTISEVQQVNAGTGGDGTYHYATDIYHMVVVVTDDHNGTLSAETTYYRGNVAPGNEVHRADFVNRYTPRAMTVDLSVAIDATKTVVSPDGTNAGYALTGGEFTFNVTDVAGKVVLTGTNTAAGQIKFNDFTFNQAGEYHYWISEVASGNGGITSDLRQWQLQVHVVNNQQTGKLEIAADGVKTYAYHRAAGNLEAPAFVNTYDPAPVNLTIKAAKNLTGRQLKNHEFTFQLMDGDLIVSETYNDAAGNVIFDIAIDKAGTYTYTIKELVPQNKAGGVTYASDTTSITVTVVDDHSGQLKIDNVASITKDTGYTFVNEYKAAPTAAAVKAKKILNGRDMTAGEFTFELVDSNNAVVKEAVNDLNGKVVFPEITFTQAGNFAYTIREKQGSDSAITYDAAIYTVSIKITDNMAGQLSAEVSYGTTDGAEPVFVNTYTAPITSGEGTSPEPAPEPDAIYVTLTGTKILEGATLKDGQFRFVVYNEWGHEIGYGTNTADGKIKFDPIPVSAEGTHIWTIKEVNNGEMSIVYDTNKIQVKVDVVELEDTYEATVHYPKSGIVFTNKTSGYIAPLTGDDAPIGLYLGILAVVVAALAGLLIWRKKKEQQDN